MKLIDWLPGEWRFEFGQSPAGEYGDNEIVQEFRQGKEDWQSPPFTARHVYTWFVLDNGYAVGINEGPNGNSYPVKKVRLSGTRMLDKVWRDKLAGLPEAGMGYQRVTVIFADGGVREDVLVVNGQECELPDGDAGREIKDIRASGGLEANWIEEEPPVMNEAERRRRIRKKIDDAILALPKPVHVETLMSSEKESREMTREEKADLLNQHEFYHGTKSDAETLRTEFSGTRFDTKTGIGMWGEGIYITDDKAWAKDFAKMAPGEGVPRILRVSLNVKNPLVVDLTSDPSERSDDEAYVLEHGGPGKTAKGLSEWAINKGYDAIALYSRIGFDEVVILRDEAISQAKPVIMEALMSSGKGSVPVKVLARLNNLIGSLGITGYTMRQIMDDVDDGSESRSRRCGSSLSKFDKKKGIAEFSSVCLKEGHKQTVEFEDFETVLELAAEDGVDIDGLEGTALFADPTVGSLLKESNVRIFCNCKSYKYTFAYLAYSLGFGELGDAWDSPPNIRNPNYIGVCCKHLVSVYDHYFR